MPNNSDFLRIETSPHSYNFDRIRLLWQVDGAATMTYKGTATRLLQHDPTDAEMVLALSRIFSSTGQANDKIIALKYAHQLLSLQPKRPRSYVALGAVYFYSWLEHDYDRRDAQDALLEYRAYLRIASASDPSYHRVKEIIKWISSQPAIRSNSKEVTQNTTRA